MQRRYSFPCRCNDDTMPIGRRIRLFWYICRRIYRRNPNQKSQFSQSYLQGLLGCPTLFVTSSFFLSLRCFGLNVVFVFIQTALQQNANREHDPRTCITFSEYPVYGLPSQYNLFVHRSSDAISYILQILCRSTMPPYPRPLLLVHPR